MYKIVNKIIFFVMLAIIMGGLSMAKAEEAKQLIELDIEETNNLEAKEEPSFRDNLAKVIEVVDHFDTQYPDQAIYTDFSEDIRVTIPNLSNQQVFDYQNIIRQGLTAYRWVKKMIDEYKQSLIIPKDPPLVYAPEDYDISSKDFEYIKNDDLVVIPDFKKVISYSDNKRDYQAYKDLYAKTDDKSAKGSLKRLKQMFSHIELKKLPYYDILYDSPLTGTNGIGEWDIKDNVKVRIISELSGVWGNSEIKALVNIVIPKNRFVVGFSSKDTIKPQVSFEGSKNLLNYEYSLPMPNKLIGEDRKNWDIYRNEIAIPVVIDLKSDKEELELNAQVKFMLCDFELACEVKEFFPTFSLRAYYDYDSSVATFVRQRHIVKVPTENNKIKVVQVFVEKNKNVGEALVVEIKSQNKIKSFYASISNEEGINFERPRVSVDNKVATITVFPIDYNQSLKNKKIELLLKVNQKETLRTSVVAQEVIDAKKQEQKLSISLFLLAVLGGFILNFMPCVFPVLSIKLLSLTQFGAKVESNIKSNFYNTILGIFVSFLIIALTLSALKLLGRGVGWGMQFQNSTFLVIISFAIVLFMLQIFGVLKIYVPKFMNKILSQTSKDSFLNIFTGMFIVLMATPCTAPYLGTVIGFALAGSIVDIFVILLGVALGLSLPYMIIYALPALVIFVPAPGAWMKKLNNIMLFMLFLTLIWLFAIMLAQTNLWLCVRLALYLVVFAFVLWLNSINLEETYADYEGQSGESYKKKVSFVLSIVAAVMLFVAVIDAKAAQNKHNLKVDEYSVSTIKNDDINKLIQQNKTVLVVVGAEWCLTCYYNNALVFNNPKFVENIRKGGVEVINVDWTNYSSQVLDFMKKYGRSGLPFYVLFSPLVPDGMVLPEILTEQELSELIENISVR